MYTEIDKVSMDAVAHLFTFCPPGPEDRENVISDRLRGIVSGFRAASHLRAAERSSSEYSVGPRFEAKAFACCCGEANGRILVCTTRRWKGCRCMIVKCGVAGMFT